MPSSGSVTTGSWGSLFFFGLLAFHQFLFRTLGKYRRMCRLNKLSLENLNFLIICLGGARSLRVTRIVEGLFSRRVRGRFRYIIRRLRRRLVSRGIRSSCAQLWFSHNRLLGRLILFCSFAGLYLHTVEKVDRLNTKNMSKIRHKVQQVHITREQF